MLKRRLGTRRMSAFSAARRGGAALDAAHEQVNGVRYSPQARAAAQWLRRACGWRLPLPAPPLPASAQHASAPQQYCPPSRWHPARNTQAWQRHFGAGQRPVDLLYTALTLALGWRAATRFADSPSLRTLWLLYNLAVTLVPTMAMAAPQRYLTVRTPLLLSIRTLRWVLNARLFTPGRHAMLHTLGDRPGTRMHFSILLSGPILLALSALGLALPLNAHLPAQLVALGAMGFVAIKGCTIACQHPGMRGWYAQAARSMHILSAVATVSGLVVWLGGPCGSGHADRATVERLSKLLIHVCLTLPSSTSRWQCSQLCCTPPALPAAQHCSGFCS